MSTTTDHPEAGEVRTPTATSRAILFLKEQRQHHVRQQEDLDEHAAVARRRDQVERLAALNEQSAFHRVIVAAYGAGIALLESRGAPPRPARSRPPGAEK